MNECSSVSGRWLVALLLALAGTGFAVADTGVIDLAADLAAVREQHDLPALAAAVIVEGRLHAVGVAGVRKLGDSVKVEPNDPFHLGSCTKAMTASLAGLLVREGRLKWETPLAEYFPEWRDTMHPDYHAVTLVHLLSHRAGAPPMTAGFAPVEGKELEQIRALGSPAAQRRRLVEIVLSHAPINTPGEQKEYSNAGFIIAGAIIERVTGKDYETLLRRRLFEPLGMRTAGFGAMGMPGCVDAPWQHRRDKDKTIPVNPGPRSDNPPFLTPAGRVHCSIADWAKYAQCVLAACRGEAGLLPASCVRQLHEPPFGGDYALGWGLHPRGWAGGRALSHAGSNGMNYSVAWLAPHRNFAVLTATNRAGDDVPQVLDQLCAALIKRFLPAP